MFYCKVCNACLNSGWACYAYSEVILKMKFVVANHIEGRVFLNKTHCSPRGTERCGHSDRHGGRRGVSGFVMSSSHEWEPTDREVTMDSSTVQPRRSARVRQDVSYTTEKTDDFFCGLKGYTNFLRTRKGGDCRPCAAPAKPVDCFGCVCTLLCWTALLRFCRNSKDPCRYVTIQFSQFPGKCYTTSGVRSWRRISCPHNCTRHLWWFY